MSRLLRPAIGLVLIAAVIAAAVFARSAGDDPAAGGTSGTPGAEPVSDEEFCQAFGALDDANREFAADGNEETAGQVRSRADDVLGLAPGTDMSPQAREGLDFIVGFLATVEPDLTAAELAQRERTATLEESAAADALVEFLAATCSGE